MKITFLHKNEYRLNKQLTKTICQIGLVRDSKKSKNIICACTSIDTEDIENEHTLIIFNKNHDFDSIDFPIEKQTTISLIKEIRPSKYAISIEDMSSLYTRFEIRMNYYVSVYVKLQVSGRIVSINPKCFQEYYFYDSRPYKTRLVFAEINSKIARCVTTLI